MRSRVLILPVFALVIGCVSASSTKITVTKLTAQANPLKSCIAQPQEPGLPRFARLMHDSQWMEWPSRMASPGWPNGFHFDWYPETVPLWRSPRGGDGRFAYDANWLQFLRELQANEDAAVWIARVAAGLFNKGNEFIPILNLDQLAAGPVAESISSGGNVVKILEIRNGSGRLEMLHFEEGPPNVDEINYLKTPWLVTKFTSVSIDGELGNAGGIDVYFPNVAKNSGGYWVELERVEWFPLLPICVTAREAVQVRAQPSMDAAVKASLTIGDQILILEYLPQGSEVWGRTGRGWIPLEYQRDGQPDYLTTWEMETRPPIVFD
ncbi:MAG: hypothetical protein ACRDFQ_07485 [Anaerolineales bacterium]